MKTKLDTRETNTNGQAIFTNVAGTKPGDTVWIVVDGEGLSPVNESVQLCAEQDLLMELDLQPAHDVHIDVHTMTKKGPVDVPVVLRNQVGVVIFN